MIYHIDADHYVCTHGLDLGLALDLGPYHCHDYVSSLRSHHNHPHLNHEVEYLSVDRLPILRSRCALGIANRPLVTDLCRLDMCPPLTCDARRFFGLP